MQTFRKGPPVTLTLIMFGIFYGLGFSLIDNPSQDFRWSSVLIGIIIGLGVTALEIVLFRKKQQEEYTKSKNLNSTVHLVFIGLSSISIFIPKFFPLVEEEFLQAQIFLILSSIFFTLAFCFKIYEFRVGYHGITLEDIE